MSHDLSALADERAERLAERFPDADAAVDSILADPKLRRVLANLGPRAALVHMSVVIDEMELSREGAIALAAIALVRLLALGGGR